MTIWALEGFRIVGIDSIIRILAFLLIFEGKELLHNRNKFDGIDVSVRTTYSIDNLVNYNYIIDTWWYSYMIF